MRIILITLSSVFYAAAIFVAAATLMLPAGSPPPASPVNNPLLEESLGRLAREQAADRELVAGLKDTITTLQTELAGDRGSDALEKLSREQAADRELVADLKNTITALQAELARDREDDTLEELSREQAADRELVADLKNTITALQAELARDREDDTLEELSREQAADRELVADLKNTITALQTELARDREDDTLEELSREQAADRELVADVRETVTALQKETKEEGPAEEVPAETTPGQVIAIIGGGLFKSGQDTLTADLRAAVERVAPVIAVNPEHRISIEGHADNNPLGESLTEKYDDNSTLSLSRAKLIAGLIEEQGVSDERITVVGYGATMPLATNATEDGRAENRRVEIRLIPPARESEE